MSVYTTRWNRFNKLEKHGFPEGTIVLLFYRGSSIKLTIFNVNIEFCDVRYEYRVIYDRTI